MAYDGKDLEIMTLGPKHEQSRGLLGSFIEAVADGLGVDFRPAGSTTWKRAAQRRGIESDQLENRVVGWPGDDGSRTGFWLSLNRESRPTPLVADRRAGRPTGPDRRPVEHLGL